MNRRALGEVARVFLRLSLTGFGGPTAHLALMERELVARRGWIDHARFLHVIAVTNLLPGPNSSEVAIHLGLLRGGRLGGLVAGLCFIGPTVVMTTLLAWLYFDRGTRVSSAWALYGVRPVVAALIAVAGARLARAAVRDGPTALLGLVGLAVVLARPRWELAAMALGALAGLARHRAAGGGGGGPAAPPPSPPPSSSSSSSGALRAIAPPALLPLLGVLGARVAGAPGLAALAWIFFRTGALLFGGGYFLLPLLDPLVVAPAGWLSRTQFLDGIALVHGLPGPITSVCAFVGYGAAGVPGALVAIVAVYLPSFIAVYLAAPLVERAGAAPRVSAALAGVNAVVAGTIVATALTYARDAVRDVPAGLIAAGALLALTRTRVNAAVVVAAGAALGAAVRYFVR